ncbi:hypothetical protein C9I28_06050 [Pseudoduganella armeniaca]|uniref:Uncharacterized protein n=2 Tax=Pseudoduganella armeniaca TaxID=2072590 RepID=A0A2R4C6V9_9BURK|nr:hypothetical protein C9I28_06050 [Pseudoduganella armeniaca]
MARLLFLITAIGFAPNAAQAETLPPSSTADWSGALDPGWTCGQPTGARWEQWKKSVLLFAASNGYGFRGFCDKILESVPYKQIVRPGAILVVMRDQNNIAQYVAWYDSKFDRMGYSIFSGITPATGETYYDIRYYPHENYPIYTQAQIDDFAAWYGELFMVDNRTWEVEAHRYNASAKRVKGCYMPYTYCGTGPINFGIPNGESSVHIGFGNPSGDDVTAVISEMYYPKPSWIDKFVNVALTVGLTIAGGPIGEYVGLLAGTAENAAFAAAFGSFSSGLIQGQNPDKALLQGIKAAGLAYTGKVILNAYGEPDSLVGVAGAGCPAGDQCWYFQMANGFPPLKNLAELHDPFINWSVKAFGSIADNGWYKAITIPPFLVPGCLASDGCVAAGITIVREDEVR